MSASAGEPAATLRLDVNGLRAAKGDSNGPLSGSSGAAALCVVATVCGGLQRERGEPFASTRKGLNKARCTVRLTLESGVRAAVRKALLSSTASDSDIVLAIHELDATQAKQAAGAVGDAVCEARVNLQALATRGTEMRALAVPLTDPGGREVGSVVVTTSMLPTLTQVRDDAGVPAGASARASGGGGGDEAIGGDSVASDSAADMSADMSASASGAFDSTVFESTAFESADLAEARARRLDTPSPEPSHSPSTQSMSLVTSPEVSMDMDTRGGRAAAAAAVGDGGSESGESGRFVAVGCGEGGECAARLGGLCGVRGGSEAQGARPHLRRACGVRRRACGVRRRPCAALHWAWVDGLGTTLHPAHPPPHPAPASPPRTPAHRVCGAGPLRLVAQRFVVVPSRRAACADEAGHLRTNGCGGDAARGEAQTAGEAGDGAAEAKGEGGGGGGAPPARAGPGRASGGGGARRGGEKTGR